MDITFILPTVNMSGGIRVVAIYAKRLMERGHRVVLISPHPKQLPIWAKIKSFLKGNGWPMTISSPPSHLDGLAVEHRILDKWRPVVDEDVPEADVVVATWWETAEWVRALSPEKGAKVYFVQGHENYSHIPIERSSATYRFPMHKIVIAKWLARLMDEEYGGHDVDLVPNSVDHSLFYAPEREKSKRPSVGFLYSKTSLKGVDITLQSIGMLAQKFPDLRVISFGTTSPEWGDKMRTMVEFHLSPPQEKIRDLYACCDVWLTASRIEGFNLPAMEAMACRTPVVSTKAGWPEEAIIAGKNGALVEVDDAEGLAREAAKILSLSGSDWQIMSSNAFDTVKGSSWEKSADLFEAALEHACKRARRGEIAGRCRGA